MALPKSLDCGPLDTAEPMALSNGLPGVFGVFADPKDAKAPEPRPKALDAPGEARFAPGVVVKALDLPSPRLEVLREPFSEEPAPFVALPGVDKDSLLELIVLC